ncbi:MAG: hypothetical protein R3E39_07925 [Anaerolineae bacterium]
MATQAEHDLECLWQNLEPNRHNRALIIARLVARHGSDADRVLYANKIRTETPVSDERDAALRLLAPSPIQRVAAQIIQSQPVVPIQAEPIRMDVESARLSIALKKAPEFRLWAIARELVRREGGSGKVSKNALHEALEGFGVMITRDHYSRLLRNGAGLFWRIDPGTNTLYINSPRTVAPALVKQALDINPDLVSTNRPGGRDMYVEVSHSHEAFAAAVYAGWMSYREAPTISRAVLSVLFHRSQDTLRRWEKKRLAAVLTIRENYAQYEATQEELATWIPEHAQPYLATVRRAGRYQQVIRYRWRIANTYTTTPIRQHPKRGQNRKVATLVNRLLDQASGGYSRPERSGQPTFFFGREFEKLYFHEGKQIKRYVAQHGCSERYLWRGVDRHGRGVFEPTKSYGQTRPDERARFKDEVQHFNQMADAISQFVSVSMAG